MMRPILLLAALAAGAAAPALAQERGGLRPHGASAMLGQIEANRGCRLASTTVAMGVNRAVAPGAQVSQQTTAAATGCRPLVSTQVAAGVNLALGRGSQAEQTIAAQGPPGVLATTRFSRGANVALGARASATQRILNLTTP